MPFSFLIVNPENGFRFRESFFMNRFDATFGYMEGRGRYYALSRFFRERFGTRVFRVTVDGGFTCPNVDGKVALGGCVYCDNRSFSPNRRLPRTTIRAQVDR